MDGTVEAPCHSYANLIGGNVVPPVERNGLRVKQWKPSLDPVQTLTLKVLLLVQVEGMTSQVKQLKSSLTLV